MAKTYDWNRLPAEFINPAVKAAVDAFFACETLDEAVLAAAKLRCVCMAEVGNVPNLRENVSLIGNKIGITLSPAKGTQTQLSRMAAKEGRKCDGTVETIQRLIAVTDQDVRAQIESFLEEQRLAYPDLRTVVDAD